MPYLLANSIAIVAVFTGIIAGFYVELMKAKSRDRGRRFLDDLERLPEMSKEELSERARRFARERSPHHLLEGGISASGSLTFLIWSMRYK